MIRLIDLNELMARHAELIPLFRDSLDGDDMLASPALLLQDALRGIYQVWVREDAHGSIMAFVATEVVEWTNASVLLVKFAAIASDAHYRYDQLIEEAAPTLRRYQRARHCLYIEVWGRVGWKKELEKLGFKTKAIVMRG